MYLVITDAFSKWADIKEMPNITTATTIKAFAVYFSVWGLPSAIVTDNGPSFTSDSFKVYLEDCNVKHHRTAPYHPASNGAAENAVRSFKNKFKLLLRECASRHEALCQYLFQYRSSPHCTTEYSPAELQMGRKLRTRLSAVAMVARENVKR